MNRSWICRMASGRRSKLRDVRGPVRGGQMIQDDRRSALALLVDVSQIEPGEGESGLPEKTSHFPLGGRRTGLSSY